MEKEPMAAQTAMDATKSMCPTGRCRRIALTVFVVVGGLVAWSLSTGQSEKALPPDVADRASALLPGVAKSAGSPQMQMAPASTAAQQLPGLDVMADKLAKRLEREPGDGEGWALLARTYLELGDVAKADAAYAKALKLRPNDGAMKADYMAARAALKSPSP